MLHVALSSTALLPDAWLPLLSQHSAVRSTVVRCSAAPLEPGKPVQWQRNPKQWLADFGRGASEPAGAIMAKESEGYLTKLRRRWTEPQPIQDYRYLDRVREDKKEDLLHLQPRFTSRDWARNIVTLPMSRILRRIISPLAFNLGVSVRLHTVGLGLHFRRVPNRFLPGLGLCLATLWHIVSTLSSSVASATLYVYKEITI